MMSVALGEVAEINPRGPGRNELLPDELLEFVPMADVSEDGSMRSGERRPYREVAKGFTAFRDGDVILAKITPCFENNKIALAKVSTPYAFGSTEFHVIRGNSEKALPKYIAHFLRQDRIRYAGERRMTGSGGQRRVPKAFLEELKIPLPPLEEQKRIAAILDQADALRRLRQRAIDRLDTLGQAIFLEMFGDPFTNPKKFERQPLSGVIKFIGGSQPPKSTFVYEDGEDVVRLVQIRDFRTDEYKTYVPKNLAKRPFTEDDVMIGRYGPPVFQILRGLSGTYNVALMKAQPLDGVTKDFVYFLLKEPRLHNYVVANSERTAGQSGVNLELLNKYPAYRPPTEVQHEFSRRIHALNHMQKKSLESLDKAEALFHSLQHQAFRGEL